MTRPEDRLMEIALREVVGGRTPPDLTARVLVAVRGRRAARRRTRARRLLAAAAAALLLLAGALAGWWSRGGSGGPVEPVGSIATADRALSVRGPDGAVREDSRLAAGDGIVRPGAGATLTLGGGARVRLGPDAVVRLGDPSRGPALHLRSGRAEISGPAGNELRLGTPFGEVRVAAAGEVDLELPAPPGVSAAESLRWLDGRPDAPSLLATARLVPAAVGGTVVPPGSLFVRVRGGKTSVGPAPAPEDREALVALVAGASVDSASVDPSAPGAMERLKAVDMARAGIRDRLRTDPAARRWLVGRLAALPVAREPRAAFASLLLADPNRLAAELLDRIVAAEPALLPEDDLVALAQAGSAAAVSALRRMMADPPGYGPVRGALLLALRGDDSGRAVLRDASAFGEVFPFLPDRVLMGAAGLRRLGDPEPWRLAVDRVREEVGRLLASGDFRRSRWLLLRAEYYRRAARGDDVPLGGDDPAAAWVDREAASIPDEATLRERLRDL